MASALQGVDEYVLGISEFVAASPTSYHAAHEAGRQLSAAGFVRVHEDQEWPALDSAVGFYVIRDGAIVAWRAGSAVNAKSPVRILGAHTDSPSFKLVPEPGFQKSGWAQAAVEIYGGPLLNSWLDRDLAIAGRVITTSGEEMVVRTGAVARIPQLAIHLDRDANNGLKLAKQANTQPVLGVDLGEAGDPLALVAAAAGIEAGDIAGHDLLLADTQKPARIGATGQFLASGRLDNLSSVYAGLRALIDNAPAPDSIGMLAAFDHEEIGSETRSGASGPFLDDVLQRIYDALAASGTDRRIAASWSWILSADAGHSLHPNYAEKHNPHVQPVAGRGPVLKVNAVQRYATDGHGAALWRSLCEGAGVQRQTFVCNNDIPCGSTIGPLAATRLGIRTVDVGVPLLSMHSARELAHVSDLQGLYLVFSEFFN